MTLEPDARSQLWRREIARQPLEVRKRINQSMLAYRERLLPYVSGRTTEEKRARAFILASGMAGVLVAARAIAGPARAVNGCWPRRAHSIWRRLPPKRRDKKFAVYDYDCNLLSEYACLKSSKSLTSQKRIRTLRPPSHSNGALRWAERRAGYSADNRFPQVQGASPF